MVVKRDRTRFRAPAEKRTRRDRAKEEEFRKMKSFIAIDHFKGRFWSINDIFWY